MTIQTDGSDDRTGLPADRSVRDLVPSTGAAMVVGAAAVLAGSALLVQRKTAEAEENNPPAGRFIHIDGVRLHYIERGQGEAVAIFHGNGSMTKEMALSGLIGRLSRNYRVIVFDRPGYGYSTRPRMRAWTPGHQATLLMRALRRIGVERPILIGHSWGALVAVAAALKRPDSVRGLVLVGGYYYPTARADVALFSPPAIPILGDLLSYTVSPLIARAIWPLLMRKIFGPRQVTWRFSEKFPKWMALRPETIRASAEETAMLIPSAATWQKHYNELRLPVAIIAGDDDRFVTTAHHSERLHRDVRGSTLRVVPGIGHMLHHFAQREILAAVDEIAGQEHRAARGPRGKKRRQPV